MLPCKQVIPFVFNHLQSCSHAKSYLQRKSETSHKVPRPSMWHIRYKDSGGPADRIRRAVILLAHGLQATNWNLICRQSPNWCFEGASRSPASNRFSLFSSTYSHAAVRNLICSENPKQLTKCRCDAIDSSATRLRMRTDRKPNGLARPTHPRTAICQRRIVPSAIWTDEGSH